MKNDLKNLIKQLKTAGDNFTKFGTQVPGAVDKVLFKGLNDIRNTIIITMKNTKRSGNFRKATKSGKKHYHSEPGYPPAIDTGELKDSYLFNVRNMTGEIGSGKEYAPWLEDGTKKMDARPVLEPSVNAHKDGIIDDIFKIVKDVGINSFRRAR